MQNKDVLFAFNNTFLLFQFSEYHEQLKNCNVTFK